ncbi:hypothetical protein G4B88_001065 [Cannabis sativa]|uniref:SAWADEE domain-containing protein n=1 Tax=Cannabis sativa TaxID=3483 RepID=A0A7J6EDH6_CANSA|nr:hypothetical protein G4B88_001065 [Cannabis sativa]
MDRLRPRDTKSFTGFTNTEIKKMEKMLDESRENVLDKGFCQCVARAFNRSSGRAGKPIVKWAAVHSWFYNVKHESPKASINVLEGASLPVKAIKDSEKQKEEKNIVLTDLEFEARSAKDEACTGEAEVRVRFVGFGAEEDEWINIKNAVRERSVPLEHSECYKVKVGDSVLCFQEKKDQASYYDARVLDIQRRMHDIRGCRKEYISRDYAVDQLIRPVVSTNELDNDSI